MHGIKTPVQDGKNGIDGKRPAFPIFPLPISKDIVIQQTGQ